jgi:hypothetical protein
MRVEFREVEFAGDQEDYGPERVEPAKAAGLAPGGLEQSIQCLQETNGPACLFPRDNALEVAARQGGTALP